MATVTSTAPNSLPSRPHIPRLSYRTASDPNSQVRRPSTSTAATSCSHATLYAPSKAPISPFTSPTTVTFPDSAPGANSSPSSPSSPIQNMTNKAKGKGPSSLMNFFTVKEPSSQAFADYEAYMRKQTASRGGRVTTVGLPGVSSAKLPPSVPKVNSKWDGVPQAVKDKEKERERRLSSSLSLSSYRPWSGGRSDDSFSQSSLRSSGSSQMARGDQSPSLSIRKINSSMSSNSPRVEGRRSSQGHIRDFASVSEVIREVSATDNTSVTRPTLSGKLSSSCSRSSPSNLPRKSLTHEHSRERSCTDSYFGLPSLSTSPSSSAPGTPADPLPITPLDLPPLQFLQPVVGIPHEPGDGIKTTVLEMPSDSAVLLNSAGPNILGPPASAKRGLAAQLNDEGEVADGVKPHPILRKGVTPRLDQQPIRPPLSSYSLHTDQQLSRSINTPQIRSGGPRTKNFAVTPWEIPGPPPGNTAGELDLTPTPLSGGGLGRKSKMSMFGRSP